MIVAKEKPDGQTSAAVGAASAVWVLVTTPANAMLKRSATAALEAKRLANSFFKLLPDDQNPTQT